MAQKTSAVSDEPIEVLFVLQNKFDLMDLAGPLEVLHWARHDKNDECKWRPVPNVNLSQVLLLFMCVVFIY
jgi:transcriptional regulator GlxA family with amidase domain